VQNIGRKLTMELKRAVRYATSQRSVPDGTVFSF